MGDAKEMLLSSRPQTVVSSTSPGGEGTVVFEWRVFTQDTAQLLNEV